MNFCEASAEIWQLVGYVLFIFKIVIPIILIILGMIDLGKAVVSSDEKAINKAATTLGKRAIAAVLIFFVPTIIGLIFRMVGSFGDVKDQYDVCAACITNPTGSGENGCKTYVEHQDTVDVIED